ncbi:hypothetical protein TWF718_003746 [Orbilia javanica]|uniref:CFEM domain-containing protein n=1 Tax=Orbilia javanica TaxID=47235 RepID=A0AAN8NYS2_9PEZI
MPTSIFTFSTSILLLNTLSSVLAQPPWLFGQDSDDTGSCGQGCFFQNIRNSGCQFPNIGCVCQVQSFIPDLTTCVNGRCNATEAEEVLQAASSLCASAGTASVTQTLILEPTPTTSRTSQIATESETSPSTLATSARRSNTQPNGRATSTSSGTSMITSGTALPSTDGGPTSPSETQSTSAPATNGTQTTIGAIVGGVVGGFGGISLILAMIWLIMREKNKGNSIRALPHWMLKPHTDQIDDQPQPIWDGQQVFTWNPRVNSAVELPATIARQELPAS